MKMSDERKHWSGLEPQQRADSPQLVVAKRRSRLIGAAGLASESKNSKLPYGRREALPQGRTFLVRLRRTAGFFTYGSNSGMIPDCQEATSRC